MKRKRLLRIFLIFIMVYLIFGFIIIYILGFGNLVSEAIKIVSTIDEPNALLILIGWGIGLVLVTNFTGPAPLILLAFLVWLSYFLEKHLKRSNKSSFKIIK